MARTKKPSISPCVWTLDDRDGSYDTGCGEKFQFTDGGPRENGARFCCYCGAPVRAPQEGPTR